MGCGPSTDATHRSHSHNNSYSNDHNNHAPDDQDMVHHTRSVSVEHSQHSHEHQNGSPAGHSSQVSQNGHHQSLLQQTIHNLTEEDPTEILDQHWVRQRKPKVVDESKSDEPEDEITEIKRTNDAKKVMGRVCNLIDTRCNKGEVSEGMPRPNVDLNDFYTDPNFPFEVAMDGEPDIDRLQWMRPVEFCENPLLFADGTTRFDIEQGGAGTCWFLSILSSLADKPEVIQQIIPEDAYKVGTDDYDGVFHCRLWKFGQWVDVYCDDYLPVKQWGDGFIPWGARSTDRNEMWVSLMEKAFARFNGGYPQVYGGWAGDAFIALTGGVAERIEAKDITPAALYSRVKNALNSGAVIACSCPDSMDGQMGLVGGHAYTVTGAIKIEHQGIAVPMLRVRNPWGVGKGEWLGAWSDDSPQWDEISEEVKAKMKLKDREDGEFWMTLEDYMIYFSDTHMCNFTPDFDKDGKEDGLNQLCCVLGEWKGESAAGCDPDIKMKNQKYLFSVPKKGLDEEGKLPIVLQILQYKTHIKSNEPPFYMRADLYKIESQGKKGSTVHLVMDEMTNYLDYYGGADYAYRYRLMPGDYMILPTTLEPGQERAFCLRLFSSVPIKCRELSSDPAVYVRKAEQSFIQHGQKYQLDNINVQMGAWVIEKSAGGQISQPTFHLNPQYTFTITGEDPEPMMVDLLQHNTKPKLPIGYRIFPVSKNDKLPLELNAIYQLYESCLSDINGKNPFIIGYEAEGYYQVPPGDYVIIVFTNDPDVPKDFALVVATRRGYKVPLRLCN